MARGIFLVFWVFFFNLFFWPHRVACGILVPRPGIEAVPPALGAQSLNHWTPREVLSCFILKFLIVHLLRGESQGGEVQKRVW